MEMLDITAPEYVDIQISHDGKTIWVNVDGVCRLRICQMKNPVFVNDERIGEEAEAEYYATYPNWTSHDPR